MHLYCDESGNTGANFLDPKQPIFSLASTSLEESVSCDLIAPLFRPGQTEVKYAVSKRSSRGRQAILKMFSRGLISAENSSIAVTDKKFSLSCHLVDKLIEPALYEIGVDIYAGDVALQLANNFHFYGPLAFPGGSWDKLLVALERALRERTSQACANFDLVLANAASAADADAGILLDMVQMAMGRTEEHLSPFTHSSAFDPIVAAFVDLISRQMQRTPDWFPVTHDHAKSLRQQEQFLRTLMSPDAEEVCVGYGSRKMELPLRISRLSFEDSRKYPQLQLADLLAGAAVDVITAISNGADDSFHRELLDVCLGDLVTNPVLPNFHFKPGAAPSTSEKSLVDGVARFLSRNESTDS